MGVSEKRNSRGLQLERIFDCLFKSFYGLQGQISDILLHFPDMQHLYFDNRGKDLNEPVKKKAFVVITGDKGGND